MKKARKKTEFNVLQVTSELINEPSQKTIRDMISGVTQVELLHNRIIVNTRSARHEFCVGDWICKNDKGLISKITDLDFKMNYEVI